MLHRELLIDGMEEVDGTIVCGDIDDGTIVWDDIDGALASICDGSIDDALVNDEVGAMDDNEGVVEIASNGIDGEAFD